MQSVLDRLGGFSQQNSFYTVLGESFLCLGQMGNLWFTLLTSEEVEERLGCFRKKHYCVEGPSGFPPCRDFLTKRRRTEGKQLHETSVPRE